MMFSGSFHVKDLWRAMKSPLSFLLSRLNPLSDTSGNLECQDCGAFRGWAAKTGNKAMIYFDFLSLCSLPVDLSPKFSVSLLPQIYHRCSLELIPCIHEEFSDISWILLDNGLKPTNNLLFFIRRWQLPQQPSLGKEEANLLLQNIPNFTSLPLRVCTLPNQPRWSSDFPDPVFLAAGLKIAWEIWFSSWKFLISVLQTPQHSWWLQCLHLGSGHKKKENQSWASPLCSRENSVTWYKLFSTRFLYGSNTWKIILNNF